MKLFLITAFAFLDLVLGEKPIVPDYHETIGIKLAARIKAAEESRDPRITGGWASPLGANPWLGGLLITLTSGDISFCGSSLLSNTKVVTAAHCMSRTRQCIVVLGSTTLFSGGTRVTTKNFTVHTNYNQNNLHNDIAMITLPSRVTYTNNIKPIRLPAGAELTNSFIGVWATAAGYGRTFDYIQNAKPIQNQVNLQVISNAQSEAVYGRHMIIPSTLCVATPQGQSTCNGDSGGPLVAKSGGSPVLIGITSFGYDRCTIGKPACFARVSSFVSWIQARL